VAADRDGTRGVDVGGGGGGGGERLSDGGIFFLFFLHVLGFRIQ
jgi:hypothetical protein